MTPIEFSGTTANLMKSCERPYGELKVLERIVLGDKPSPVPEKPSWAEGGTACYIDDKRNTIQIRRIFLIRDVDNSLKLLDSYSPMSSLFESENQRNQLIRNLSEIADQRVEAYIEESGGAELEGYVEWSPYMPC
jgi:hypothetical protein